MLTLIIITAVAAALGSTVLLWPAFGLLSILLVPFAASLITTAVVLLIVHAAPHHYRHRPVDALENGGPHW
jgi:hypothetical protein